MFAFVENTQDRLCIVISFFFGKKINLNSSGNNRKTPLYLVPFGVFSDFSAVWTSVYYYADTINTLTRIQFSTKATFKSKWRLAIWIHLKQSG